MALYEVVIYNQDVADAVKNDELHRLDDEWANDHYIEFNGNSESEVMQRARLKYPPEQGYVISSVQLSDGF